MLVVEDILKSMKKHFPRWMDIRRKNSSTGSLLLESMSEELSDINSAIEDYKKDFFIDNYYKKEDDILAFLYKTEIGIIDIEDLKVIHPNYEITTDENYFYENNNVCYYSEGILYFKEEFEEVQYSIAGYATVSSLEKMHVWNVFDEFAVFVGLKRFQWETNKELLNRILNKSNRVINSSEDGLKEAIITSLTNFDPNLKKEDIIIEKPTPENLMAYYENFNTLLDHLNDINRDVYKNKKWDIDTWNFDKKSIDYIPHAWDIALDFYVNGIGDNDDLKVIVVDNATTTDATVNIYKKTLEAINAYVKKHDIKEEFNFKLRKYKNDLSVEKVKYSISASEVVEIDPSATQIELHQQELEESEVLVQDIVDDYVLNTKVIDNSVLDTNFKYRLRFIPTNTLGNFKIDELKQTNSEDTSNKTNLIKSQAGFKYNDIFNESIISGKVIKHATNKYHFNYIENIKKTTKGLEANNPSIYSNLTLNANGCSNEMLSYEYECDEVPLLYNNIKLNNCYVINNEIISDTTEDEKSIEINTEANSLSMKIEGPYIIKYSIDNENIITKTKYENIEDEFKIDCYNTPKKIKATIVFPESNAKIYDIKYSKFDFIVTTEYGKLINKFDRDFLPYEDKNNVFIKMRSYTGSPLILKYVHIGSEINESDYYGDIIFDPSKGDKLIAKYNDCKLQLTKLNKETNEVIETIDNYIPYKIYSAENNDSEIGLTLTNYDNIEKIHEDDCYISTISYSSTNVQYLVKIPYGKSIHKINISGLSKVKIKSFSLDFIFKQKGYPKESYKFFAAKNSNNIIVKNSSSKDLSYLKIKKEDMFENLNIKNIRIINNKNNDIIAKFSQINTSETDTSTEFITNDFEGFFDHITFIPAKSNIYSAINEYNMILPESNNVKIVNTFSKGYDSKKKMFYEVKCLNDCFDIFFESSNSKFSLDEDTLTIKYKKTEDLKYNYEDIDIKTSLSLSSRIELPSYFLLPNKEKINLDEYMILNEEDIIYKTKDTDLKNDNMYYNSESVYVNICGFNKLKYSNIYQIVAVNKVNDNSTISPLIENVHYKVLHDEGIVVWLDKELINKKTIVDINYYRKKASYIDYDVDELYTKLKFNVESLSLIESIDFKDLNESSSISLNNYESYKNSDLVLVKCKEPGFTAFIEKDLLRFNKKTEENTVAVKSGYYYIDGLEYYLFANDNSIDIEKIDDVYFNNVFKENKKYYLKQEANNFIKNSSMISNIENNIFDVNLEEKNTVSSQIINSLTACNTYNFWNTIGCNLSIVNGLNGQGLKIEFIDKINGCAYVKLSDFYNKDVNNMLSFYMNGSNSKAFLGIEKVINSNTSTFNKESVVEIVSEIEKSLYEDSIYEIEIPKSIYNYYLIINGDCIIDDILIIDSNKYNIELHKKNIDILNFDIEEYIYSNYVTRLYLTDKNGASFNGTEILNNKVVNTSSVHWGYTSIKSINTYNDFKKCILNNIDLVQVNDKCISKTTNSKGSILTDIIHLGNTKVIKNVAFKINNIMLENMKDIKITVLTANSINDDFIEVSKHLSPIDLIPGNFLSSYMKLLVEIPANKVINNIEVFVEYLSNDLYHPNNLLTLEGSYISKVLDIGYPERYLLKEISFSENNMPIDKYAFEIRASKENSNKTVWTDWKTITIENGEIVNRIVFENYRYFQFRLKLKGDNASIKINYIDLEVI